MAQHNTQNNHKQFYIATANLLNFANPKRIYYDNAPAYDEQSYQRKVAGITDLLSKANADIIAVQEVWDSNALEAVATGLGFTPDQVIVPLASNDSYSRYTQGRGAQGTPAVGIISRFKPLEQSYCMTWLARL